MYHLNFSLKRLTSLKDWQDDFKQIHLNSEGSFYTWHLEQTLKLVSL